MSKPRADMNVLIVEDEFFVATLLQSMLDEMGFRHIVHESSVPTALQAINTSLPDLCLLDLSLNSAMSYPVASALKASKVPFAFLTGYSDSGLEKEWRAHPRLEKPYSGERLQAMLMRLGV